jgi:TonB family protein
MYPSRVKIHARRAEAAAPLVKRFETFSVTFARTISKGVDFGPWLRRFKHQIESNWLVPQAAGMLRGRVIVQFYVLRNGAIVDLRVIEPATVPAFTTSSLNALRLSNPTAALPPEYPDDRVLFTVTFRYN